MLNATGFRTAVDDLKQGGPVSLPPSMAPTFFRMDLWNALSWTMIPFILIFLFMDLFDTLGTLIGVSEQAGFIKDDKMPWQFYSRYTDVFYGRAAKAEGTTAKTKSAKAKLAAWKDYYQQLGDIVAELGEEKKTIDEIRLRNTKIPRNQQEKAMRNATNKHAELTDVFLDAARNYPKTKKTKRSTTPKR